MIGRRPPDPLFILRGHTSPISCLAVDDNSHILFSGTQAGDISLWDLSTRRQTIQNRRLHIGGVLQTGFLSNSTVYSHGKDGELYIFDMESNFESSVASYKCGLLTFCKASIADLQTKNTLFIPLENDSIGLLDIRDKTINPLVPQQKTKGMVMSCQGDSSSNCIIAYESGHVLIFDCRTHTVLKEERIFSSPVISLAVSSDGVSYICGSSQNELAFCQQMEGVLSLYHTPNPGNVSLSIREDSRLVAIGGKDGTVRVMDYRKHCPLAILANHHLSVNVVMYTKDNLLVSGGDDHNIMIWNLYQHGKR